MHDALARSVQSPDLPLPEPQMDISVQPQWKMTARRRRALSLAWGEAQPPANGTVVSGTPSGFSGVRVPGQSSPAVSAEVPPAAPAVEPLRMTVTSSVGPGQAGFVHYFVLDRPDGEREIQVGIELPDQRIAWSFPEVGVVVTDFIQNANVSVNGRIYGVEHLYAIRPFNDETAMKQLRENLIPRVVPWVDDEVAYCELKAPKGEACLSCLGFVLRILFPGLFPDYPKLPAEFGVLGNGVTYTTEDLLIYLAGLHRVPSQEQRFRQIAEAMLPQALREELIRLTHSFNTEETGRAMAATPVPAPRAQPTHTRPLLVLPPSGPRMGTRPPEKKRL